MRFRITLGALWLGAVVTATVVALVTRPAHAHVPGKSAFYLVFLTIPGVLLALTMIKRRSVLIATGVIAAAWSVVLSWLTMQSTRTGSGFFILLTPMIAFLIVGVGCGVDVLLRASRK